MTTLSSSLQGASYAPNVASGPEPHHDDESGLSNAAQQYTREEGERSADSSRDHSALLQCVVRKELDQVLSEVTDSGAPAGITPLIAMPDPEIHIGNYGPLNTPLSEEDARYIIHTAHQAPFGKGSETIVDLSVRKTWELHADQFELRSTKWQQSISAMIRSIATDMGVDPERPRFHAELYKMLLYEKGAMFKAHQDTEKVPGMFGTLVVCLPSPHTGGDVFVRSGAYQKVLQTATVPNAFLWWYSDVHHEVRPVLSGMRWVLTYNLVRNNIAGPVSIATPVMSELELILSSWKYQIEMGTAKSKKLVYLFDHQYTETGMKLPLLKGHDLRKAEALRRVCEKTGFLLFLASVEQTKHVSVDEIYYPYGYDPYDEEDDEDDEDEDEDNLDGEDLRMFNRSNQAEKSREANCKVDYSLTALYDQDGRKITFDLDIAQSDFIQPHPFEDQEPYDEEAGGYTGNEGTTDTYWYRSGGLVLIPPNEIASFLRLNILAPSSYKLGGKGSERAALALDFLVDLVKKNPSEKVYRESLRLLIVRIINVNNGVANETSFFPLGAFGNELLANMVQGCLQMDDVLLCKDAIASFTQIDNKTLAIIGVALENRPFSDFETSLESRLPQFKGLTPLFNALTCLLGGELTKETIASANKSEVGHWAWKKLEEALQSMSALYSEDAKILLQICSLYQGSEEENLEKRITPVVQRHGQNTPFLITFLNRLWDANQTLNLQHVLQKLFTLLVPDVIANFNLDKWATFRDAPNTTRTYGNATPTLRMRPIRGQDIAMFLDHCNSLELFQEMQDILLGLQKHSVTAHLDDLVPIFIDCLSIVAKSMRKWSIPHTHPFYRTLFQNILTTYVKNYVGTEPSKPRDCARRGVQCSCADCTKLNQFLQDPYEPVGRFPLAEKRRRHLHQNLAAQKVDATWHTENTRSPHTLVVTKTEKEYSGYLAEWTRRKVAAEKVLKEKFNERVLKTLLAEKYEQIVEMRVLLRAGAPGRTAAATALGSTTGNVQNSLVGTASTTGKRKASEMESGIIDLTGE